MLLALAEEEMIPGGTAGLVSAGGLLALCDEVADGKDHDNDEGGYHRLLGAWRVNWWDFYHGTHYGGATWMKETPDGHSLLAAIPESVEGVNLNNPGVDFDTNDSVPALVESRFVWMPFAIVPDNPGIVLANNSLFYRVSEQNDSKDWNSDGDKLDLVLVRTALGTNDQGSHSVGASTYMGVASDVPRPVIDVDSSATSPLAGAVISSEHDAGKPGTDYDGDGDKDDYVVRWFRF
jgi:hypothetical protein